MTGLRFGKWTAIFRAEDHITKSGYHFTKWFCRCDCGTEKAVTANSLLSGRSSSCGCDKSANAITAKKNFTTHGETKTRLYQIWAGMRKRCNNQNSYNYKHYGGRGISVCSEWDDFLAFKEWAVNNGYDDSLSIDRIDVDGDYTPLNCRWADNITQANNKRTNHKIEHNGVIYTVAELARLIEVPYDYLCENYNKGRTVDEIIDMRKQLEQLKQND